MCDYELASAICTPSHINPYLVLPGAGPVRRDVSSTEQASGSQILRVSAVDSRHGNRPAGWAAESLKVKQAGTWWSRAWLCE